MRKLFMIVLAILLFCGGCATGPSVCDSIDPGVSVLCDAVDGTDYRLEDIGNALIIANAVAIGEGVYTKDEAVELCTDLIAVLELDESIVTEELKAMFEKYPGLWDVLTIYINTSVPELNPYKTDRDMIVVWLRARVDSMTVE